LKQKPPIGLEPRRFREKAAHADDGDGAVVFLHAHSRRPNPTNLIKNKHAGGTPAAEVNLAVQGRAGKKSGQLIFIDNPRNNFNLN
jgi:hypothetical protein